MPVKTTTVSRVLLAALATAGASVALAQSSVQIYGRLNTSVEHQKVGGSSLTGLFNNNSRFGFVGSEDLGGGLKAGFQLESGFESDTGAGTGSTGALAFQRQSEVNLSGSLGKLRLGRFGAATYFGIADYGALDEPNHDTGSIADALYDYVMRNTNKIAYRSPVMAGLTLEAQASLHEKTTGAVQKNGYDLYANWERGPLALGAGFTQLGDDRQFALRGHYIWNALQVGAYYQRSDNGSGSLCSNGGAGCGTRAARVTAVYRAGASELALGYGWASRWSHVPGSSARQWILGYNHHLSKRTKLYAAYTRIDNGSGVAYGYNFKGGVGYGQDASSLSVGLRHAF
jgi:predicted porin